MNTSFLGLAVATVLTACGIETGSSNGLNFSLLLSVATVLTACGIETRLSNTMAGRASVATVLTACGIET